MSYVSRFTGKLTIDPPLTWAELREDPAREQERQKLLDLDHTFMIKVAESERDTPEGTLIAREGVEVVQVPFDELRGDGWEQEIQDIVSRHPGHRFVGTILRTGQDNDDIERVVCDGGPVVLWEKALITWPSDGSTFTWPQPDPEPVPAWLARMRAGR